MKASLIAAFAVLSATTLWPGDASACQAGARGCPFNVRMARGTDTILLRGKTEHNRDCCSYRFWARGGQVLRWHFSGPSTRMVISYPDGEVDGPGIPETLPLPISGFYILDVHPNLMAEGAYGTFQLTLTIR